MAEHDSSNEKNQNKASESQESLEQDSLDEPTPSPVLGSQESPDQKSFDNNTPTPESSEPKKPLLIPRLVCAIIYILCILLGFFIVYFFFPEPIGFQKKLVSFGAPLLLSLITFILTYFVYDDDIVIDKIKSIKLKREFHASADLSFAIAVFIAAFLCFNATHIPFVNNLFGKATMAPVQEPEEDLSERILKSREDLKDIVIKWETLDEGETACKSIVKDKPSELGRKFMALAQQVKNLEDKLHSEIEAYRNAQYAYIITSDVECDAKIAEVYARKSIKAGNLALELIEEIERKVESLSEGENSYEKSLIDDWMTKDFTKERILFRNALGYSLLYRWSNQDREARAENLRETLQEIDREQFYNQNSVNLERNRFVTPFLTNDNVSPKVSSFLHPCPQTCGLPTPQLDEGT
ncbi:MAG: hypothetical protein AAGG51_14225 [Cyanobacteria bacterium P01_G01_bin.54]